MLPGDLITESQMNLLEGLVGQHQLQPPSDLPALGYSFSDLDFIRRFTIPEQAPSHQVEHPSLLDFSVLSLAFGLGSAHVVLMLVLEKALLFELILGPVHHILFVRFDKVLELSIRVVRPLKVLLYLFVLDFLFQILILILSHTDTGCCFWEKVYLFLDQFFEHQV